MEANLFEQLFDLIAPLSPVIATILAILGALVILAIGIDSVLPKEKQFSKKMFKIPVLGLLLKALVKFSPLNFDH